MNGLIGRQISFKNGMLWKMFSSGLVGECALFACYHFVLVSFSGLGFWGGGSDCCRVSEPLAEKKVCAKDSDENVKILGGFI